MYRRIVMVAVATALLALAYPAAQAADTAKEKAPDKGHHEHGPFDKCARACADCSLQCDSCFKHCLSLVADGKKDHLQSMQLCNDCGTVCAAAQKIVSRGGPLSATICDACAKSCDTCGAACEKFPDDTHMTACAKACRDCAKACREMIKHAGHHEHGETK
jgi:hypothetical protein